MTEIYSYLVGECKYYIYIYIYIYFSKKQMKQMTET